MSCLMCGLKSIKFVQRALKTIPDDFPFYNYIQKKEVGDIYLGIMPIKLRKLFALSLLLESKVDKLITELKNNPPQTKKEMENHNDKFSKAMVNFELISELFAISLYFEDKNFRTPTFFVRIGNGNELEIVTTPELDSFEQMGDGEECPNNKRDPENHNIM